MPLFLSERFGDFLGDRDRFDRGEGDPVVENIDVCVLRKNDPLPVWVLLSLAFGVLLSSFRSIPVLKNGISEAMFMVSATSSRTLNLLPGSFSRIKGVSYIEPCMLGITVSPRFFLPKPEDDVLLKFTLLW